VSSSWSDLHERLRRALDAMDASRATANDELWRQRSRSLTGRSQETLERDLFDHVIVARRGGVLLAVPVAAASEVRQVECVPVPGGGDVVAGVFQVRGRVYGLVDLAPFFAQPEASTAGGGSFALMVTGEAGQLGLRVDEPIGLRHVWSDELDDGLGEHQLEFVSRVTRDLVHILDVEALMTSPAVRVTAGRQR
jgi:chemotaxis signal transduction protein